MRVPCVCHPLFPHSFPHIPLSLLLPLLYLCHHSHVWIICGSASSPHPSSSCSHSQANAHIYTPRTFPSCSTFPSLFSQVVSSPWLLCNPHTYSLLYCHLFVLLPVEPLQPPPLPFILISTPVICSQGFMALLPGQAFWMLPEPLSVRLWWPPTWLEEKT